MPSEVARRLREKEMKRFLKQLFCRHEFSRVFVDAVNFERWKHCSKCQLTVPAE